MTTDSARQRRRGRRSSYATPDSGPSRQEHRALGLYLVLVMGLVVAALVILLVAVSMRMQQPTTVTLSSTATQVRPTLAVASTITPTRTLVSSIKPTSPATPIPARAAPVSLPLTPTPNPVYSLTLSDIFPSRNIDIFHFDPQRLRTIIVTGDVVPARSTDAMIRNHGDNFLITVSETKDILAAGDLTIANLEAPLIKDCPRTDSGFTLCGRPGFVDALTAAGVDVATLENNHIWNFDQAGVFETVQYLDAANITWVDRFTPAIKDVRGLKFGIVAVNDVGVTMNRPAFAAQIKTLRPQVDVLIAAIHWGAEYVAVPEIARGVADDSPYELAHLAINSGADLVVGNHPHWVQGVELYKGKSITYAHGNFIFDQMWSYETRVGVIGRYTFYDRGLVKVDLIPTLIQDYGKPVPLKGNEAQAVLDKMKAATLEIAKRGAAVP